MQRNIAASRVAKAARLKREEALRKNKARKYRVKEGFISENHTEFLLNYG